MTRVLMPFPADAVLAGTINQRVAATVDAVDFVVAGIPRRWAG